MDCAADLLGELSKIRKWSVQVMDFYALLCSGLEVEEELRELAKTTFNLEIRVEKYLASNRHNASSSMKPACCVPHDILNPFPGMPMEREFGLSSCRSFDQTPSRMKFFLRDPVERSAFWQFIYEYSLDQWEDIIGRWIEKINVDSGKSLGSGTARSANDKSQGSVNEPSLLESASLWLRLTRNQGGPTTRQKKIVEYLIEREGRAKPVDISFGCKLKWLDADRSSKSFCKIVNKGASKSGQPWILVMNNCEVTVARKPPEGH